jgi:hypothetical protein
MHGSEKRVRAFRVLRAFSKYHSSPMYLSREMGTTLMSDAEAFRFVPKDEFDVVDTGHSGMCGMIYAVGGEKRTIISSRELDALIAEKYLVEK